MMNIVDELTDGQWFDICNFLMEDISSLPNKGICIVASCSGDEPTVELVLETERMHWVTGLPGRLLSSAILEDNPFSPNSDEVERIIDGLRVTIARLEVALAQRREWQLAKPI